MWALLACLYFHFQLDFQRMEWYYEYCVTSFQNGIYIVVPFNDVTIIYERLYQIRHEGLTNSM